MQWVEPPWCSLGAPLVESDRRRGTHCGCVELVAHGHEEGEGGEGEEHGRAGPEVDAERVHVLAHLDMDRTVQAQCTVQCTVQAQCTVHVLAGCARSTDEVSRSARKVGNLIDCSEFLADARQAKVHSSGHPFLSRESRGRTARNASGAPLEPSLSLLTPRASSSFSRAARMRSRKTGSHAMAFTDWMPRSISPVHRTLRTQGGTHHQHTADRK